MGASCPDLPERRLSRAVNSVCGMRLWRFLANASTRTSINFARTLRGVDRPRHRSLQTSSGSVAIGGEALVFRLPASAVAARLASVSAGSSSRLSCRSSNAASRLAMRSR